MSNMTKVRVSNQYGDKKKVTLYTIEGHDAVAAHAAELLVRWGLVAAVPDGEDSAGRAKLRLPTTGELVTRAFDIAEAFAVMARERGHTVAVPDLNEVNAEHDEKERATEQSSRA